MHLLTRGRILSLWNISDICVQVVGEINNLKNHLRRILRSMMKNAAHEEQRFIYVACHALFPAVWGVP